MKKLSTSFYKKFHEIRDQYGNVEYGHEDMLPAVISLMRSDGVDEDAVLRDAAKAVLDSADRADDRAHQGFLSFNAHIALGERRRIKRGSMNDAQVNRRKRLIDENAINQQKAWQVETHFLNSCIDALDGMPPETTVSDVLSEESPGTTAAAAE